MLVGVCLLVLSRSGFYAADVVDSHSFRSVIARSSSVPESVFHAALPPPLVTIGLVFFDKDTHEG